MHSTNDDPEVSELNMILNNSASVHVLLQMMFQI